MANLEHFKPMADLFIKAVKELEHKRGYIKIVCPECDGEKCNECDDLGAMQVCETCLDTGECEYRVDVDRYIVGRCDDGVSCGRLEKFNAEDLEEI